MTAIAGIWCFSGESQTSVARSMLTAQRQYGPHDQAVCSLGAASFGRALYRVLPEDRFDRQPLIDASNRWLLAADLRLDNRDELLRDLGQPLRGDVSDAHVLLLSWLQWGERTLDRLLGDFAFALWDRIENSLLLVRDPAGQRPLHYHRGAASISFASMPQGLHAVPEVPRRVDQEQLAAFVADMPPEGGATFFTRIARVEPGQWLRFDRTGVTSGRYWQMPRRELRYRNEDDYFEALREQLDRAVRARLRGAGQVVGAHLSGGLDSSAIAATAATLTEFESARVIGFTSAPRPGFSGPSVTGRISDESAVAATVAAAHANMEHVIVRSGSTSPLDLLGFGDELFQEPVGHPCNIVWWSAVLDAARARGISVMLTGEVGNLTISAGGLSTLAQFIRRGRLLRWWREARGIAGTGPNWRGVLATSLGPWIPGSIWRTLVASHVLGEANGSRLIRPPLRALIQGRAARQSRILRGPGHDRELRWKLISEHQPANFRKGILARWGIDERDPTSDRRLAEFCFSLPPELFLSRGVTRRLARVGLADRLPRAVIEAARGYQYADWYGQIDQPRLRRALVKLEAGPAASLLDFDALRDRVASWPQSDWNSMENIGEFRVSFLMALSAASFANTFG